VAKITFLKQYKKDNSLEPVGPEVNKGRVGKHRGTAKSKVRKG